MFKKIAINIEVLGDAAAYGDDTRAYKLLLSSESSGTEQRNEAYWGDVSGLDVGGITNLIRLVDGKQRAVLGTRVEFVNSVIKKALANWYEDVIKVEFDIDMGIGKEVGVNIDQFIGDEYAVKAVLYKNNEENNKEENNAEKIAAHLAAAVAKPQDNEDPSAFFIYTETDAPLKKLSICVLDEATEKQTTIGLAVKAHTNTHSIHIETADVIQVIETDINNKSTVIDSKGLVLSHIEASIKKIFLNYNAQNHKHKHGGRSFSIHEGCPW